jgi:PHP family Zn ribbon phosphoesterase
MVKYRSFDCGRGILKGVYERVTEQGDLENHNRSRAEGII